MNLKILAPISFMFLCMSSCDADVGHQRKNSEMVRVCHVPFDVATSAPMTKSNFSRSCFDIGELSVDDASYRLIFSAIENSKPGPFLSEGIRVRVTLADGTDIYIDDAGGVASRGLNVKMDPESFLRVKGVVKKLARKKGMIGVE